MSRHLLILGTLLGLTWLASCQQTSQPTISTLYPSTMTTASAALGEVSMVSPTVIASVAASIYTPMLAETPTTPTLPAAPDSSPLAITAMI